MAGKAAASNELNELIVRVDSGCVSQVYSSAPTAVSVWDNDVEDSFLERDFGPLEHTDRDEAFVSIIQKRHLKQVY